MQKKHNPSRFYTTRVIKDSTVNVEIPRFQYEKAKRSSTRLTAAQNPASSLERPQACSRSIADAAKHRHTQCPENLRRGAAGKVRRSRQSSPCNEPQQRRRDHDLRNGRQDILGEISQKTQQPPKKCLTDLRPA